MAFRNVFTFTSASFSFYSFVLIFLKLISFLFFPGLHLSDTRRSYISSWNTRLTQLCEINEKKYNPEEGKKLNEKFKVQMRIWDV